MKKPSKPKPKPAHEKIRALLEAAVPGAEELDEKLKRAFWLSPKERDLRLD